MEVTKVGSRATAPDLISMRPRQQTAEIAGQGTKVLETTAAVLRSFGISVRTARDAEVNVFDTALAYGMGHSEQLIAKAFGKSANVVIASKVPPKNFVWPAADESGLDEVFPRD
jgi:aryl-alcohol dehydrogenase-like predicted oxidoreductase